MFYLHIKTLGGHERRVPLPAGVASVGRWFGNTIVLDEYGVSGRHAEFEVAGPDVLLRDLASTNGLFVNGRRVESARLHSGDRVLLGSVVVVLQEALSDRIRIEGSAGAELQDEDLRPSPLERTYVPTAPAPLGGRIGAVVAADRDPSALLDLLQEVLADGTAGASDGFAQALGAVVRFMGASEGYLVGVRGAGDWRLLAGTTEQGPPALAGGALRQLAETGTEICIDAVGDPGEGCIVLPLPATGRAEGALYLRMASEAMQAARGRLASVRPVLAALALLVQRGGAQSELRRTRLALASGLEWPPHAEGFRAASYELLAHSTAMREVLDRLERLAAEPGPVVIRGEAGAGKERAARRLHALSPRRRGPFLPVACGRAAEAEERRALFDPGGKLELAEGGTAYFDEIAALGRAVQEALAAFLRSEPRVRVVLGTRHAAGAPRADLEPALAAALETVAAVEIPPLRDRKEDVIPLAQAFAREAAAAGHRHVLGLSMDACRALRDHAWPGNLTELRCVVSRAVLLARDAILDVDLLPLDIAGGRIDLHGLDALALARERSWREAKLAFERVYFAEVLRAHDGNVAASAKHAGIARKNLYRKLRQQGLAPKGE